MNILLVGGDAQAQAENLNALDQALAMMAAEAGAVLVVEGESKPLRLAAQKRLSDSFVAALSGRRLDVGTFMTFLLSGKVLLVRDVAHSDAPPELLALLSQEGFISTIGVPLQAGGKLLGGLLVATRHAGRLTTRDARWLGVMGQQVGVAIENARFGSTGHCPDRCSSLLTFRTALAHGHCPAAIHCLAQCTTFRSDSADSHSTRKRQPGSARD